MKEWTLFDDARILALLNKGWTRRQIAADFGVTRNAICGKIHRLVYKPPAEIAVVSDEDGVEIAFEDVLLAQPVFEPPLAPMPSLGSWYIGQRVTVDRIRAFVMGERRFDDWSGSGTIDMIRSGSIRVVESRYVAWINKEEFDRVTPNRM